MTSSIVGFDLVLPEGWHGIPRDLADFRTWSRAEAGRLCASTDEGRVVLVDAEAAPGLPSGDAALDPAAVLADGIAAVAEAAADAGITGMETVYLVRRPDLGRVDAMATLVAQQGLTAEQFTADLARLVAEDDGGRLHAQEIRGDVPAGEVRGVHLLIGHLDPDLGEGVAHLEERLSLGVFPPHCVDMVEVTAIANGVGAFEDMPKELFDLLAGLTIETEVRR